MPKTEAQKKANDKWAAKAYDRLAIRIPAGERDLFKDFAESNGESLAQYIRKSCYERAGRACPSMKEE
jgi:uncharacterized protein (DUF1778 family)